MGKTTMDSRDVYYRQAKLEGWRARSAFKLLQIDQQLGLFQNVTHAVDLCAAPGSWSQVLSRRIYLPVKNSLSANQSVALPIIVSVDLQPIAPIEGVIGLVGDITQSDVAQSVISYLQGHQAQLVVSDGAHDVTGIHDMDQLAQGELIFAALNIACAVLAPGGTFVSKIFKGDDVSFIQSQLQLLFTEHYIIKPQSSRSCSLEAFAVGRGYRAPVSLGAQPGTLWKVPALGEESGEEGKKECGQADKYVKYLMCGDLSGWETAKGAGVEST